MELIQFEMGDGVLDYVILCHIQQYFSYIKAVCFIGGGNRRNHRPATSHWQIQLGNVLSQQCINKLLYLFVGKGCVFSFDPVGSYERETYRAGGSASAMLQPLLDNQVSTG